ncbi:FBD-associated F-box protein At4g10400-like [Silene latifolia]|uniref:FBD-associated F-box protein At4g10400-like n=1 Tax=Silene latifolia TaxID=37657 RepID=UPI003D787743
MIPDCKKSKPGQLNSRDRLSDLPDFIIHHIISYLGTKEAYRTSVLSKRWTQISATSPVLEFHHNNISNGDTARLLEYIDARMQRYSKENLRILTLELKFPTTDLELACKFDEWLEIAVQNQVAKFDFTGPANSNYKVPQILFSSKSLRRLDCSKVKIPYYEAVDLVSLEYLGLSDVVVDERMLFHMVSSCLLLTELSISDCSGFKNLVIPRCSKLEFLDIDRTLPVDGRVILETSSLRKFQYIPKDSNDYENPWPIISNGGLLRNLRFVSVSSLSITDEALAELLPELASLENLVFWGCHMLTSIKISNTQLKEICLHDCYTLLDIVIDAPSLKKFKFDGEIDPSLSITITSQADCSIYIYTMPCYFDTDRFLRLKKLLTGLNSCNILKILLLDELSTEVSQFANKLAYNCLDYELIFTLAQTLMIVFLKSRGDDIEFDEEESGNADLGPPCDIRELKLTLLYWDLSISSLSALVNGLFWTCHPDIMSLRVDLGRHNLTVKPLLRKLEGMVKCFKHPLKRIEVEGVNCSDFLKSISRDGVDGATSLVQYVIDVDHLTGTVNFKHNIAISVSCSTSYLYSW